MSTVPLTYYVQFRDANGTIITGDGGQSWFAATQLGFTDLQDSSSGNTAEAARLTLDPLRFTLGADNALPALFLDEAAGTNLQQVEVAGYSGSGSSATLVTDDVFKQAYVTDDALASGGATLALEAQAVVERSYTAANGTVTLSSTDGFNVATQKVDNSTNTATGAAGHAPDAPLAGVPTAVPAATALIYYVQFRAADGTALTGIGGQSWFAVTAIAAADTQNVTGTGTLPTIGTIELGNLTFTVGGDALPLLLQQQATGTAFGEVELAGYSAAGVTGGLVQDDLSKGAQIAAITTASDGSVSLSLASSDQVQSNYAVPGNVLNPSPVTDGWNVTTDTADTSSDAAAPILGTPSAAATSVLTYYVQVRNQAGTLLTGDDGLTWFAASAVSFGSDSAVSSSGVGAALSYASLDFTLAPNSVRGALFAQQAAKAVDRIEIAAYNSAGTLVQDDLFKGALLTTDTLASDGTAALVYAPVSEVFNQYAPGPLGLGTTTTTQGWNTATNRADTGTATLGGAAGAALDAPAAAPTTTAASGALTYFVQIRNAAGLLLRGAGGQSWFAVSDVGFETTQGSGNSGSIVFSNLAFQLGADQIVPGFLTNEGSGQVELQIELAGYAANGSSVQLMQDDLFKSAIFASDTRLASGSTALNFFAAGYLEKDTAADGTAAAPVGFNQTTGTADNTTNTVTGSAGYALAAQSKVEPTVASDPAVVTTYMQLRVPNGAITDGNGDSWFAVTGLIVPTTQQLASDDGVASTGKFQIDNVTLTLADPLLQTALLKALAGGTALQSVEFASYDGTGTAANLVQDVELTQASVQGLATGSDGGSAVSLAAGAVIERSYSAVSGTNVVTSTAGWSQLTNAADANFTGVASLTGTPTALGSAAPFSFYVTFRDANGTVLTDSTGASAFAVSGLDVPATAVTTLTGQHSLSYAPLNLTIDPDSLLPQLFADEAADTQYSMEIGGYDTGGSMPLRRIDDLFGHVSTNTMTANADGSETLSFDYGSEATTVLARMPDTGIPIAATASFDEENNDAGTYYAVTLPEFSLPASAVCFVAGTRIATTRGEIAVEALAVGDLVVTAAGEQRPIRWLGHHTIDCRDHPEPDAVLPVRVRAHAFGHGLPASELWLSPGHAVCVDLLGEMLVPIGHLVNGATIVQEDVAQITYWHVELDSHDLLLAHGMPAESYIDVGNRDFFRNGSGSPDGVARTVADYCRPLIQELSILEFLHARLLDRAGALGWAIETVPQVPHLVVDGARLEPEMAEGLARFLLPAEACQVWLATPTFVPRHVGINADCRLLGLELTSIRITDGLSFERKVAASDPMLCIGFHSAEETGRVWTTGWSLLPASLWKERRGAFFLTVAFEPGEGRRVWRHTALDADGATARPSLRLVHAA